MRKLLLLISVLCLSVALKAQAPEPLPSDPNVRYGKLENGMTYYIRHNAYPEKRADFYIAQKVGSMQEEESQRGLAHFLEHMAFNGTKHYPGRKTMLNYMETIGAKFGVNVNAYTSFDETVYNLSDIPMTRESIVDSCLLVLHDWSSFITLEDDEIDKERLIIKEEWRTRDNAYMRIFEKQLPVLFKDSKYANRMPIGSMDVVENFDYQELKDYYHKWYRPDLQAIIIVGDIDADKVEAKVINMFSDIPAPVDPAERVYYPVPNNKEPLITVVTDVEATDTRVYLFVKHDIIPAEIKKTEMGLLASLVKGMAASMLSNRLGEIAVKPDSPFSGAYAYDGDFFVSKTKSAWTSLVISKEGNVDASLAALVKENERVRQFGFTEAEIERAKANLLQMYEDAYNNRNKQENSSYVNEYVRSFTDDEAIPGIEFEYAYFKRVAPMIDVKFVNRIVSQILKDENVVITVSGPQKEGLEYTTEQELLSVYNTAKKEKIEAYKERISKEPLVKNLPPAGSVVKTDTDEKLGTTLWTLSNGMKVAYKKTDFKDDEILMLASSRGGTSRVADEDIYNASLISAVPYIGGLGNFSTVDLNKVLAGKSASVSPSVGRWDQSLSGSSNIRDLEVMLQLTYLHFTSVRKDENVYASRVDFIRDQLTNARNNPMSIYRDSINVAMYKDNPRAKNMKLEDISKLNYDRIINLYKEVYANPGSFTFSFVGTIDESVLRPLVEKYLACLPSGDVDVTYTPIDMSIRKGNYENTFSQKMENPKASVFNLYSGTLTRDLKSKVAISALKQVLDIVYTRTVREEEGGTYGVSTRAGISRIPEGQSSLQISYDTNPEKAKSINPIIERELNSIIENGPTEEDFQKVREYMLKSYQQSVRENSYWLGTIDSYYYHGEDMHSDYHNTIDKLTRDDVKAVLKNLLQQENNMEVMMLPQ